MNANATTEIRELTAQELDQVNGGLIFEAAAIALMISCGSGALFGAIGHVVDWLFGD
jgi:lactobin A/cerein 7B family class IIb bacteriocin